MGHKETAEVRDAMAKSGQFGLWFLLFVVSGLAFLVLSIMAIPWAFAALLVLVVSAIRLSSIID